MNQLEGTFNLSEHSTNEIIVHKIYQCHVFQNKDTATFIRFVLNCTHITFLLALELPRPPHWIICSQFF